MDKRLIVAFLMFPLAFVVTVIIFRKPVPSSPIVLPAQIQETQNPKIEIFTPRVELQYPTATEWVEAKHEDELTVGTKIKTDKSGVAQIVYPNGTVTRLNTETTVTLKQFQETPQKVTVFVEAGKIWSRITKLFGAESYQSESTNLVATVRGTIYEHEVAKTNQDKISVLSSKVIVNCVKAKYELELGEDEKTTTTCTALPKKTTVAPAEKQTDWVQFNKEEDKKLPKRFGREKYDEKEEEDTQEVKAASTAAPTASPSPTPQPTLPTGGPSPTPISKSLIIEKVSVTCSPYTQPDCGDRHTRMTLYVTGFDPNKSFNIKLLDGNQKFIADADLGKETTATPNSIDTHFSYFITKGGYNILLEQDGQKTISPVTVQ